MISRAGSNDSDLVNATLAGSRDAFAQIVSRYQSLICSLAYSATGSLGQSEDLAQETFITAWKHLGHLREREKLRSWLCGIARNRINNFLRREGREPVREAEPLEHAMESHSAEPLPVEYTMSKEEEAILWRSLEKIPEIYREPLVLYYREHQSVNAVAEKLELSEDTVHQRLSRGRKMLQEQVLAFVEGALSRTNPGKAFTLGVLAALPALTLPSKAAVIGAVAAKGGAAVKGAGMMGMFSAICSPLLAIFGNYASYRMSMEEAQTDEEKVRVKALFLNSLLITLGLSVILAVPLFWAYRNQPNLSDMYLLFGLFFSQALVIYFLTLGAFAFAGLAKRRRYLARILAEDHAGNFPESAYEYRSRWSLFGLPLVHVRIGDRFDILRGPVKAWIAVGSSHAVGVIFASGGVAVAPISFGGIAFGVLSFGAISAGVIPFGAIALGIWAFGGLAAGWQICCGCGAAWNAALGGVVFAHDFALGGMAHAMQANTDTAEQFMQQHFFFRISRMMSEYNFWLMLFFMSPIAIKSWIVARARRRSEQAA